MRVWMGVWMGVRVRERVRVSGGGWHACDRAACTPFASHHLLTHGQAVAHLGGVINREDNADTYPGNIVRVRVRVRGGLGLASPNPVLQQSLLGLVRLGATSPSPTPTPLAAPGRAGSPAARTPEP